MSDVFGFKFPKEHGLVAFWFATLYLGIMASIFQGVDYLKLVFALNFSFIIILSYLKIKKMVKSKFKLIPWIQLVTIAFYTLLGLLTVFTWYLFYLFVGLGLLTVMWAFLAYHTRRHDFNELGFGVLTLTFHFLIIFEYASGFENNEIFFKYLVIWWIFGGIANASVIRVGSMRNKISHSTPFYRTLLFSVTIIPFIILNFIHPVFLLSLIEPFYQNYNQKSKHTIISHDGLTIRQAGFSLVYSLVFSMIVMTLGIYFQFYN